MILGNHDYEGNPNAQVEFSTSSANSDGLWQMPDRNYDFTAGGGSVHLFGLDTNGVQGAVRRYHPEAQAALTENIKKLDESLGASKAPWKLVFGTS